MAGSRIKGITIELDANTVPLTDALKKVDNSLKDTQTKLKDVNKLLKLDPTNINLLRQKHDLLKKAVADTRDRQKELKKVLDDMKKSGDNTAAAQEAQRNLQNELVETTAKLKGLESQLRASHPAIEAFSGKCAELADKTKKISAAAAGAAAAMVGIAVKAAASADDLLTMSNVTGLTVEELQKMKYAAPFIDVSLETMTGSVQKLTKQMSSGSEVFETLGISINDESGNMRSATDVWYEAIAALGKVENETERDALSMELFGKSAMEMAGVVDDGGEALKALGEEAENTGLILGQDAVESAVAFNDQMDKIKQTGEQAFLKLGATLAETLLPHFEKLVEYVVQALEWFGSLDGNTQTLILTILGLVAALSPTLALLGQLNSAITLLSGPVGIAIAVIGALIAIGTLLYQNWDTITAKTKEMAETLKREWNTAKENVTKAVNELKDKAKKAFDDMTSWITEKLNGFFDTCKGIWDKITGIFGQKVEGNVEIHETTVKTTYTQQNPAGTTGYASAYDNPVLFTKPTVLPTINGMKRFGDGGGSELVIGTDRLMQMINQASQGGEQNVTVNVTLQGDASKIFRVVRDENQKFKGSTGRSAFDY